MRTALSAIIAACSPPLKRPQPGKARGKRYHLTTLLVTIFLAKLCGQDTPIEIADWAKNHAEALVQLLNLKRTWMPHHNTIRRLFQNILDEAEFDRLTQEYQQQAKQGEQLAMDGKTFQIVERGGDYLWVVKENQGRLYQDIAPLFAPNKPRPGSGKINTDFQQAQTVNKGYGLLAERRIQTSAMLNDYLDWPCLGQVYRLERCISWVRQGKVIKTSQEVEYGITSLTREKGSPKRMMQVRRNHWLVEPACIIVGTSPSATMPPA